MLEAKGNKLGNELKYSKRLCKGFDLAAGILKGLFAEGEKKQ